MTQFTLLATIICLAYLQTTQAVLGVDLSASFNNFICLKDAGYSFVIPRGYKSYGEVDMIGLQNLQNAKAAGLITDVYFFPCKGKKPVNQQVDEFIGAFGDSFGQDYGTVWVDVEYNPSTGCQWSTVDFVGNCDFLTEIINALQSKGKLIGIYASKSQWETIFGSATNCSNFKTLPLWYPHYDKDPSFADWPKYQFGGWSRPSIKQYQGTTTVCNVGVDLNYY